MVGVPGRSKACHNCKKRRIKCGGEFPGCRNCARSKRTCTGYQRKHTFILSQDMDVSELSRSHNNSLLTEDEPGSGLVMVSRWRIDQNKPAIPSSGDKSLSSNETAMTSSLPQPISSRNAYREFVLFSFIQNELPISDSVKLPFGERNDWMLRILNLPSLTPALENAALAICTARLGRRDNRAALVHESLKLYTKGMSEIRRAILNTSMRNDEQSLAACFALLLYEITECPGGTIDGYMAHYEGIMKLLQIRGAGAHTSGLSHSVFQLLRLHTMFQGIVQYRKTFLADPEWRSVPWSSKPDSKSLFDQLVDILLDIPVFLAQRQSLKKITDPQELISNILESISEAWKTESILESWFRHFETTVPGALFHPDLSRINSVVDNADLGKLFPVAFRFPTFIVGQCLVYYWVALMSVQAHICFSYRSLAQLLQTIQSMGRSNLPCTCTVEQQPPHCLQHFAIELLPSLGRREAWPRAAAYNICQSAEYFLEDNMCAFGQVSMLPALVLAKGFWQHAVGDWSREIAWVEDMLRHIYTSGNGIAGTLD